MNDRQWSLIEEIFNAAADLPADARPGYLDAHCPDPEVRREVESLLAAERQAETYFENQIADVAKSAAAEHDAQSREDRLGPYRLIRSLGSGGMGEVYLAERADEAYDSQVAVKVLRGPAPPRDLLERLVAERQILARLNHPNIARLLDGGTAGNGAPFVVMELVEGRSLDVYCDSQRLSIRERIEIFRKICAAVHYAHQSLVIHRDLKPANILVTEDGEPKLLDFGIAKLQESAENVAGIPQTGPMTRLMTPNYASPEQVKGDPVGAPSDVYALGVVLYGLLSGRPPYELGSESMLEIGRVVCEYDPPPPSSLATQDPPPPEGAPEQGETAEAVSRRRGCSPEQLEKQLRGDLDNIVLKAMSKAPERRYASAEQLAEDLAWHVEGLPVRAQPDSWSYRAGKFVRRHRWPVAAAAAFAVLLIAFAVTSVLAARRIAAERDVAQAARQEAETVAVFLTDIFGVADPRETRGDAVTAREILDWGAERISREMSGQPAMQARLQGALSDIYRNLGLYEEAQGLAAESLATRLDALPETHPEVAESLNRLARLEQLRGRYEQAEQLYRRALEIDRGGGAGARQAVANDLNGLAMVLRDRADYEQAEQLAREALDLRREALSGEHPEIAASLHNLGTVLYRQGRYEEAEQALREALEIDRRAKGELHPDTAVTLNSLGALLRQTGDLGQAEEVFGKAMTASLEIYGERHPAVSDNLRSLAEVLRESGRPQEAREMLELALEIDQSALGPEHLDVAADWTALGRLAQQGGDLEQAEDFYRKALALRRGALAADHPLVASSLLELGSLLADSDRAPEAEPLLREALAGFEKALPAGHWQIAEAQTFLGLDLALQGRYQDAERILTGGPAAEGVEPRQRKRALEVLAYVYKASGRPEEAARVEQSLERIP